MKRIGFVCLVLVLALGSMGAAFAHWQQELFVDVTVKTGTVLVGYEDWSSDDEAVAKCDPGAIDDATRIDPDYDKNVAGCWVDLVTQKGLHDATPIYEVAEITLCNGYPSYTNIVTLVVANGGSVPVKLEKLAIDKNDNGEIDAGEEIDPDVVHDLDLDGDTKVDINLTVSSVGQIDPCDTADKTVTIHVKQTAPQDATLTFTLIQKYTQWNLVP